jgi:phosphohistidine phosphatase
MKLYFLRHGIAADRAEQGSDFDRPLTDEGRKRMAREAKALAKLNLELDDIITSPLVRAKQTAEIVADRLKMPDKVIQDDRLSPDFDSQRLARVLQDHANADAIMLVGHEPDFSQMVEQLAGGAKVDLKKGGLACVDLPDPSSLNGQLVLLVPPKVLTL